MTMPGFTAEAWVRETSGAFYGGGAAGCSPGSLNVLAQLRRLPIGPVGRCFSWCFLNGGSSLGCFFLCDPGVLRQVNQG